MKVLLNCHVPFQLAHGGAQIQIEQSRAALVRLGVEVEPLRWWDETQAGDVLHHFGRIPMLLLRAAHEHGLKVVMSPFLSGLGARPAWQRRLQRIALVGLRAFAPAGMKTTFGWYSYREADACVAMTPYEATLMCQMHTARPERVRVIPNGVESVFLESPARSRGRWLVCTATLIELKQVLKLAEMAVIAQTPLWVIGKAYAETDSYAQRFVEFARKNSAFVRYEGPIADRQQLAWIYREARGFVLLSKWESLSLSALEAAACECPLLLSDLPWARGTFKEKAAYCPPHESAAATAPVLRSFYESAPRLPLPPKPMSWTDVGRELKSLYEALTSPHQRGNRAKTASA